MEKYITTETRKVSELDPSFGNPRKINRKGQDSLRESIKLHGDFGSFIIDDKNRIIGGNQRAIVMNEEDPSTEVTCRVLHGYDEQELRQINVKANTHAGEWDFDILAEWFGDFDLELKKDKEDIEKRQIKELMPVNMEKYDFFVIVVRNEIDYNTVSRKLGLDNCVVKYTEKAKKKARAVFYEGQF